MSAKHILLGVSSFLLLGTFGLASPLQITNADFSAIPIVCPLGYSYQSFGGDCNSNPPQQDFNHTPGFGWTFLLVSGNGLTAPNSPFNPPDFTGLPFTQAAFLQNEGSDVYQDIDGFSAGVNYMLSFYVGSRYDNGNDGNQTVQALIDGNVIGTWALVSFTPFELENVPFSVATDGVHRLEFRGIVPGDHTAFVSGVSIDEVPEPASLTLTIAGVLGVIHRLRRQTS